MMVWGCMGTCYVPLSIMVVLACDPKDLFVECVTMFTVQSPWLILVGFVE
jgi:hypothetical protein